MPSKPLISLPDKAPTGVGEVVISAPVNATWAIGIWLRSTLGAASEVAEAALADAVANRVEAAYRRLFEKRRVRTATSE
jgi:hypothetical protein